MFGCLLKRQWKRCVLLIAFFCCVLLIQQRSQWETEGQYYNDHQEYMQQYDLSDKRLFFAQLEKDRIESEEIVEDIRYFEGYDGQIAEGFIDEMDIVAGIAYYADYDMVLWRQQMLSLPGKFSETVIDDSRMTWELDYLLGNQREFESIIENNREIMRRGIRRGSASTPKYELALEQLDQITDDFSVTNTAQTIRLIEFLAGDWYILVLLCLCFFSVFSGMTQGRLMHQVLICKTGVRRYTLCQLLASIGLFALCLLVYYGGVLFACCNGSLQTYAWNLPIQAVYGSWFNGGTILLDLKVWQYVLILMGLKALFCLGLLSLILLISLLSRNNIVSAIGCLILCGSLLLLHGGGTGAGLLIGDCSLLLDDLCWELIGDYIVPKIVIYVTAVLLLTVLINAVTVLISKPIIRKWVK